MHNTIGIFIWACSWLTLADVGKHVLALSCLIISAIITYFPYCLVGKLNVIFLTNIFTITHLKIDRGIMGAVLKSAR